MMYAPTPPPPRTTTNPLPAPVLRTDGLAITAMVVGICAAVFFEVPIIAIACGVLAIIFGHKARRKIAADVTLKGAGMAMAGFITGIVGASLGVLVFLAASSATTSF
jgi:hypothetical protein